MAKLKIGKNLILPRLDSIKDPEVKRVLQEILRVLQESNSINYSDLAGIDERLTGGGL